MKNVITEISTATSGSTTLPNTQQDVVFIHDAGVTLTYTVNFPTNPVDGQTVCVTSAGGITTLSLSATVGTIIGALTGMVAGGNGTWMYSITRNKWFRIR